jgi:hypothetical protein
MQEHAPGVGQPFGSIPGALGSINLLMHLFDNHPLLRTQEELRAALFALLGPFLYAILFPLREPFVFGKLKHFV